jgi:predicted PolB exonuclease-like 3'-5' exonuclease
MEEKEMLEKFWQGVKNYKEFVSFNGRQFDVPFLIIRSAINKIRPSLNLMSNRYLKFQNYGIKHIDLQDQLAFYGAVRRKGNLHLYCNAFGIRSPKSEGVSGDDVGRLFKNREYRQIAEYNSWDLIATAELYERWEKYIKF